MATLDFTIGAPVFCRDEKCGRLTRVAVDPESWEVVQLIVESGVVSKHARVVPRAAVAETTADRIVLAVGREELEGYPEFRETAFRIAPDWEEHLAHFSRAEVPTTAVLIPGPTESTASSEVVDEKVREGVSLDLNLVARGTTVRYGQEELGKLDHVIVDAESGRVTGLVVRHGTLVPRRAVIPAAAVDEVGEEAIAVNLSKEAFDALPEY